MIHSICHRFQQKALLNNFQKIVFLWCIFWFFSYTPFFFVKLFKHLYNQLSNLKLPSFFKLIYSVDPQQCSQKLLTFFCESKKKFSSFQRKIVFNMMKNEKWKIKIFLTLLLFLICLIAGSRCVLKKQKNCKV